MKLNRSYFHISTWCVLVIFLFSSCSAECTTANNMSLTYDYLRLTRNFLDASILLFNEGCKNQGLARLYYMFFSLHTINIYRKKRNPKLQGKKKHEQAWSGSLSKKELKKAFGKNGFLNIRHKCDYSFLSEKDLNEHMSFWLNKTENGFDSLILEVQNSIDNLGKCNIQNCDCKMKHERLIDNCQKQLDSITDDYLKLFKEQKSFTNKSF